VADLLDGAYTSSCIGHIKNVYHVTYHNAEANRHNTCSNNGQRAYVHAVPTMTRLPLALLLRPLSPLL
jgi:hypothetical protein